MTIQINPDYLEAYYNRGCCYFNSQDYRAAIADFSQAYLNDDFPCTCGTQEQHITWVSYYTPSC